VDGSEDAPSSKRSKIEEEPVAVTAVTAVYQLPAVESGILPFLNVIPSATGKLLKYKRHVSADKWAYTSWAPILDWMAKDKTVPIVHKRTFYKGVLDIYPTCGRVWKDFCEAEIASGKADLVEEYFTRSLLVCQHVPLWVVYLNYICCKQHVSLITAREESVTAFEFAITHIGHDAESGPVWDLYLTYLREMSCANVFEESNRMATIRRVYQRAIATPFDGLEQMWKSYQAWETQLDAKLASELTQKFAATYTNARVAQRERSTYLKGIRRSQMAVPPTEVGDMAQQLLLWKRLILYEKTSKIAGKKKD
jgi:cleavage stimulation factor subunit 3